MITFHEVVDCERCKKMVIDTDAIWMESQIDKEVYPFCSEECAIASDRERFADMIDDAHERVRDKRDGI